MNINSLNKTHFSNIFYYLQDGDIKVLGCTSKKMHELVTEELKARDRKTEQLASRFVITRTFNIQHISNARLFPIGDEHGNEDCVRDRSAFIGFLSRRAPVILLIEGISSMVRIADIFEPKLTRFIGAPSAKMFSWIKSLSTEPAFKANIHAVGWDSCKSKEPMAWLSIRKQNILQRKESIKQAYKNALQIQATHLSSLLPEHLKIPRMWKDLGLEEFKLKETEVLSFIENPLNLDEKTLLGSLFIDYFIPRFSDQVSHFVNENLEEIKTNQKELFEAYETYQSRRSYCLQESKRIEQDYNELARKTHALIQDNLLDRNTSMATTFQKVDAYRLTLGIGEYYIVAITGSDHLEARREDDEHDLSVIYKELEHHKAAILLPRIHATDPAYRGRSWFVEDEVPANEH